MLFEPAETNVVASVRDRAKLQQMARDRLACPPMPRMPRVGKMFRRVGQILSEAPQLAWDRESCLYAV